MIDNRVIKIIPTPPKKYEAYLYLIRIWKKELKKWKYYLGWHLGNFEGDLDNYWHTQKKDEIRKDFATAEKIEYEILEYGRASDMAYSEKKMLTDENAADSDDWYNESNGGGKYSMGYKGMNKVNEVWDKIERAKAGQDGGYPTGQLSKAQIEKIIDEGGLMQPREEKINLAHLKVLKDGFDDGPGAADPTEWPPIVLFMPKIGSKNIPRIIGGNHESKACVDSKHGYALNTIEIPYTDWHPFSDTDKRRIGNRLNPLEKHQSLSTDFVTFAVWAVGECDDKKLYKKNDDNTEEIPDIYHKAILDEMKFMNYSWSQRKIIYGKMQIIVDTAEIQRENIDDNIMDWSVEAMKENPDVQKQYDTRIEILKTDGGYEDVLKISMGLFNIDKICYQLIEKNGYDMTSKFLIYGFFTNKKQRTDWETLEKSNSSIASLIQWNQWKKHFLDKFKIEIKFLPLTDYEAKADGWKLS